MTFLQFFHNIKRAAAFSLQTQNKKKKNFYSIIVDLLWSGVVEFIAPVAVSDVYRRKMANWHLPPIQR